MKRNRLKIKMKNSRWNKAMEMSSWGGIIAGLIVRDAVLFAYDTRTRINGIVHKEWDAEENDFVEVVNNKVHLAQYCALAVAGNHGFGLKLHERLLEKVIASLAHPEGPEQVQAYEAMEFLRSLILDELRNPTDISRAEYLVNSCRLILGMWEKNMKGEFTPKLLSMGKDKVIKDVEYCALGNYKQFAENILRENYRKNMSIKEGKDLLVRAILESCSKDHKGILGGYIEVCVLFPRDYTLLPLSRGQQTLDRAITFISGARIPEEREQRARAATQATEK